MPTRNRDYLAPCTFEKPDPNGSETPRHRCEVADIAVDDAEQRDNGGLVAGDQTRKREHPLATYSTSIIRSLVIRRLRT
ncbi:hypothetical protein ABIB80_007959 [Bradyrhizobium sp. i1.15.2]